MLGAVAAVGKLLLLAERARMVEEIRALKELLDMGAITQEEYDKKKADILGIASDDGPSCTRSDNSPSARSDEAPSAVVGGSVSETALVGEAPQADSKKKRNRIILVAVLVAVCVIALLGALSMLAEPDGVHVPTAQQIEKKANDLGSGQVQLEKSSSKTAETYDVFIDDKRVGSVDLSDVSLCITETSVDSYVDFVQMAEAVMMACDPSLDEEAVKDLLVETVDNDSSVHNGVKYSIDLSSSRLKLRVKVPSA